MKTPQGVSPAHQGGNLLSAAKLKTVVDSFVARTTRHGKMLPQSHSSATVESQRMISAFATEGIEIDPSSCTDRSVEGRGNSPSNVDNHWPLLRVQSSMQSPLILMPETRDKARIGSRIPLNPRGLKRPSNALFHIKKEVCVTRPTRWSKSTDLAET